MSAPPTPRRRREVVPSSVLGVLIFVGAELMFFAGLLSAFTINRAAAPLDTWPAPGQPHLPIGSTAFNTALLLMSGALLAVTHVLRGKRAPAARWTFLAAWLLGAAFVGLQGVEWAALLSRGLTLTSSTLGSFFYMIVGAHALHAVGALLVLGYAWLREARGALTDGFFLGTQAFWYFVVLMWPVIYARVYF